MSWADVRGGVLRGTAVELAGTAASRLLSMGRLVLIGRLFQPESYGAYSTALLVLAIPSLLTEAGLRQYVVKSSDERLRPALDTAFVLSLALSAGLFLAVLALDVPLGRALADPTLPGVLALMGAGLFECALTLPAVTWQRELRFGAARLPELAGSGAAVVLLVALERTGLQPVWVLAISYVASLLLRSAFIWALAPLRPGLRASREEVRSQLAFGLPLVAAGLVGFVSARGDDLAVRWWYGNEALGLYTLAFYGPALLQEVVWAVDRVTLPAFSRLPRREDLREAFATSVRVSAAMAAPVGLGLAAFSRPVVVAVFGARWAVAAPLLSLFAVAFALRAATGLNWGSLALATDRTRPVLRGSLLSTAFLLVAGLPLIRWLGPLGGGVYTLALVVFLAPVVRFPLIREVLGTLRDLAAGVRALAVAGAGAAGAWLLGSQAMAPLPGLAAAAGFVVAAFGATLLLDPPLRRDLRALVGPRRAPPGAAPPAAVPVVDAADVAEVVERAGEPADD